MGDFGVKFAHANIDIFGYVAYIYLPLLLYPLYALYKNANLTFRRLELGVSFSLLFIAILLLQSLIFEKGSFGNSLMFFLKDYIGYLGVWVLDIFFFLFSWLICTQRNIDLLLKQTKHKTLVILDIIKHLSLRYFQATKAFCIHLKAYLTPLLQRLFNRKQRIIDLQNALQEETKQASYNFKDVVVEKSFDESHQSYHHTHAAAPHNENSQKEQPTPAKSQTSEPTLHLELINATGEEVKLKDFFETQLAAHQDMLKNLKSHIALTQPVINLSQPTLSHTSKDSIKEDTQAALEQSLEQANTNHTIPTPPPRPLNPDVFLKPIQTQVQNENTQASQSHALPSIATSLAPNAAEDSKQTPPHTPNEQTPEQINTQQHQENRQNNEINQQINTQAQSEDNQPPKHDNLIDNRVENSASLNAPLNEISQAQNTQTPIQTPAPKIEQPSQNMQENTQSSPQAIPQSPIAAQENSRQEAPLQQNLKNPTPQTSTQWLDSIVQEIPAQTPKVPSHNHLNITELDENKELLNELEYGKIDKPKHFKLPLTSFLNQPEHKEGEIDEVEIDRKIEELLTKLKMFRVEGDIVRTYSGPIVTTFEFRPAPNIRVSKILALEDDIKLALSVPAIRIQAPIPGKDVVGIEIPNNTTQTIYLREILESALFKTSASPLTLALGKDIIGNPFITDLKKAPHLLIAGTTGSGKSVGLNAMILSLLYKNTPDNLKLLMIDPKKVEFSIYASIPHLITPIISEPKKAIIALNSAVAEMEKRLELMSEAFARDIDTYNRKMLDEGGKKLPYLVIIIDELADLMMTGGKEVEFALARIAQKGRASGIHIIVATQRPSVDVLTGLIKANLPSRISYKVGSKIDSKVILDGFGAESLLGRGDMLFKLSDSRIIRLHAPWNTEEEIEKITDFLRAQQEVEYDKTFMNEEKNDFNAFNAENAENGGLITEAKNIILQDRKTSASYLQRRLSIGFNKASNIIEQLEKEGFLSKPNIKGTREIIGQ